MNQTATMFFRVLTDSIPEKQFKPDLRNAKLISPWHDIPLRVKAVKDETVLHFLCEIPRGTTAKMEINKKVWANPILQDFKVG